MALGVKSETSFPFNQISTIYDSFAEQKDGQYFMEETSGQWYYQSSRGEMKLLVFNEKVVVDRNVPSRFQEKHCLPHLHKMLHSMSYEANIEESASSKPTEYTNDSNTFSIDYSGDAKGLQQHNKYEEIARKRRNATNAKYKCKAKRCYYTANNQHQLNMHKSIHSSIRPYQCRYCENAFKTLTCLRNHVYAHTKTKPYKCQLCTSAFISSGELQRHVRYKHTFEKPHKCPECDYQCVEIGKLHRHYRIHSGEKPFKCDRCTYESTDNFKLKRHTRVHTGEKPYKCNICPAAFSQHNSLQSHRKIHTGRSKFPCNRCTASYGRMFDLKVHIRKQHSYVGPLYCNVCNMRYHDQHSLKEHKRQHNAQSLQCELCPYVAKSMQYFETHKQLHLDDNALLCNICKQIFKAKNGLIRHQNTKHKSREQKVRDTKPKEYKCSECEKCFVRKHQLIRHEENHKATAIRKPSKDAHVGQELDTMIDTNSMEGEQLLDERMMMPNPSINISFETFVNQRMGDENELSMIELKLDYDLFRSLSTSTDVSFVECSPSCCLDMACVDPNEIHIECDNGMENLTSTPMKTFTNLNTQVDTIFQPPRSKIKIASCKRNNLMPSPLNSFQKNKTDASRSTMRRQQDIDSAFGFDEQEEDSTIIDPNIAG